MVQQERERWPSPTDDVHHIEGGVNCNFDPSETNASDPDDDKGSVRRLISEVITVGRGEKSLSPENKNDAAPRIGRMRGHTGRFLVNVACDPYSKEPPCTNHRW